MATPTDVGVVFSDTFELGYASPGSNKRLLDPIGGIPPAEA
ncbi:hypothetical protein HZU77_012830 [Neisseriaceae bacterium TC5R-5]|nr:hypothetical protein [Neisseriaceae bacterium TC5R-5]